MSPSGWRGGGWGPPGSRGRGRPPWWPEGQPWPPAGGPPPRRVGRRVLWRVAGVIAPALFLLSGMLPIRGVLAGPAGRPLHAPPRGPVFPPAAPVVLLNRH